MTEPLDAWESVSGQTMPYEMGVLQDLIAVLPNDATIVELGVCQGRSGCAMLLACQGTERTVFLIDDFNLANPGYVAPDLGETRANVEKLALLQWAKIVVSDSTEAGLKWEGPKVDLLFHDASHFYDKAKADLLAWLPHMKEDGIICMHDYTGKDESQIGVSQAGNEVLGEPTFVGARIGVWRLDE